MEEEIILKIMMSVIITAFIILIMVIVIVLVNGPQLMKKKTAHMEKIKSELYNIDCNTLKAAAINKMYYAGNGRWTDSTLSDSATESWYIKPMEVAKIAAERGCI